MLLRSLSWNGRRRRRIALRALRGRLQRLRSTLDPNPPPDNPPSLLVGRRIPYFWPSEGWQLGSVARLCTTPPFTHVVAYQRKTSALRGTADSLLDSASYGERWVLLSGPPAVGVRPAGRRRAQQ